MGAGAAVPFPEQLNSMMGLDENEVSNATTQRHGNAAGNFFNNTCQDCTTTTPFKNRAALENHAKETHHRPYTCLCTEKFSRVDNLQRHISTLRTPPVIACPYCHETFPRSDHLLQHLRSYHRISDGGNENTSGKETKRTKRCAFVECVDHGEFKSISDLTKHVRDVHDASPFPCRVSGCEKIGGKGYFRKRALLDHQEECHQGSAS